MAKNKKRTVSASATLLKEVQAPATKARMTDDEIVKKILEYRDYSRAGRSERLAINQSNWNMYNLKQDFSYKIDGQSTEFLPKMAIGVEYLCSMIMSALTNRSDEWFSADFGSDPDDVFDPPTVHKLMNFFLFQADTISFLSNCAKNGGLDSLIASKVCGYYKKVPRFTTKQVPRTKPPTDAEIETASQDKGTIEDNLRYLTFKTKVEKEIVKRWRLSLDLIDFVDFYSDPDPNPDGPLYRMQTIRLDLHKLTEMGKEYPEIYTLSEIKKIKTGFSLFEEEQNKQNKKQTQEKSITNEMAGRKKVTLTEFWGTLLDNDGYAHPDLTNTVIVIANDKYLVRKPQGNPNYTGEDPFVVTTLIDVPGSIYGKGFLDATAELNATLNEAFNLILDGMMDSIKGVKQFRKGILTNPGQGGGGITAGRVFEIEADTPLGVQVLEKVKTGEIPQDAWSVYRYLEECINESMFMNEMKLGQLPPASTKATIATLSDQSITGIFASLTRVLEDRFITPLLEKVWLEILQNIESDAFADKEIEALIGADKAARINAMPPEERFVKGANAARFSVRGISGVMQRMREQQKYLNLLQILGNSEMLMNEFLKKYNFGKFLQQIMLSLGLREDQLTLSEKEQIKEQIRQKLAQGLQNLGQPGAGAQPQLPPGNGGAPQATGNPGPQAPQEPINQTPVQEETRNIQKEFGNEQGQVPNG